MDIDITGLDKAEVLAALYNASQQFGIVHERGKKELTVEEARQELEEGDDSRRMFGKSGSRDLYFDYLHGRSLRVDLSGDTLRTTLYDRDNGVGAAERALRPLREKA